MSGFRKTTELTDLEVDHVHCEISFFAQQHVKAVNIFIQDKRMITMPSNGEALLVRQGCST